MSRWIVLVLAVAACRSAPAPHAANISHHTTAPAAPTQHVEVEATPDWVPHRKRTVVTSTSITLLDNLEFMPGSATIDPRTTPILDAFAQTMVGNPSLQLVTIRVFADDVPAHWQRIIADQRARNVIDYVVARGVARARMRPEGIPIPPRGVKARMQFEIVTRGP